MTFRPASLVVAAAVALGASAVPGAATAQTYDPYDRGYDQCEREARQRQVTAGVVGAVVGAVAGSQVAARGVRDEGSVLGAVAGAVVGSQVGRHSAACGSYGRYEDRRYDDRRYGYDSRGYDRDYGYERRPYEDRRYDDGYDDYRRPASDDDYGRYGSDTDQCRMAESTVRMPDGRIETRMVRACRDSRGVYRIVD